MSNVLIGLEAWPGLWPGIASLLLEHHRESRETLPFDPDTASLRALDLAGAMKITTARRDARLIGYITWFLAPHLQSRGIITASQGPWFVTASERHSSIGLRLFRESLQVLRTCGVSRVFPHWQIEGAGPDLRHFFERLGATLYETSWQLELSPCPPV